MGRPTAIPELKDIILSCLLLDHSSFGRYKLSTYLGLTKAKTRAVLEFLTNQGLASSSRGRSGTKLTETGKNMMEELKEFCYLDWQNQSITIEDSLVPNDKERATILMKVDDLPTSGLYERDTAVRQGADGAITMIQPQKVWIYPGEERVKVKKISLSEELSSSSYNMLTICFSSDTGSAYAGLAAILIYHLESRILKIFQQHAKF